MQEVDSFAVEDALRAARDTHDVELEVALPHQTLALTADLLDQLPADRTDAADEKIELLILGEEETVVDDIQRLAQELLLHDQGDVVVRRTLGAGEHADAVAAEDGKQLAGNALAVLHPFADDRDGGQVLFGRGRTHGAVADLGGEFLIYGLACGLGIRIADAEYDAGLGRGLADQEDADAPARQGAEEAAVHPDEADH